MAHKCTSTSPHTALAFWFRNCKTPFSAPTINCNPWDYQVHPAGEAAGSSQTWRQEGWESKQRQNNPYVKLIKVPEDRAVFPLSKNICLWRFQTWRIYIRSKFIYNLFKNPPCQSHFQQHNLSWAVLLRPQISLHTENGNHCIFCSGFSSQTQNLLNLTCLFTFYKSPSEIDAKVNLMMALVTCSTAFHRATSRGGEKKR